MKDNNKIMEEFEKDWKDFVEFEKPRFKQSILKALTTKDNQIVQDLEGLEIEKMKFEHPHSYMDTPEKVDKAYDCGCGWRNDVLNEVNSKIQKLIKKYKSKI